MNKKVDKITQWIYNNIPNADAGGCGVIALACYRRLKKEGYSSTIIFLYEKYNLDDYTTNFHIIEGTEDSNDIRACLHAIIREKDNTEYGNSFIFKQKTVRELEVTEDFLIESIYYGNWHPAFNKKKYVSRIEQVFNVNLKDIY